MTGVKEDREALTPTGDYTVDEKHQDGHAHREGVAEGRGAAAHRSCGNISTIRRTWSCSTTSIRVCGRTSLYHRDKDYLVSETARVVIVDEFTGRLMPGRRWSDGLHQAVEAKEGVKIERENQTLATITFQNYFRMYKKLSGMTGTAETEARRVRQDLQARRHRDSDQPGHGPQRSGATSSTGRKTEKFTQCVKEIKRHARRKASPFWSAPSRSRSPKSCPEL